MAHMGLGLRVGSTIPRHAKTIMGIVLNYCQYGVLYLGSHYNTGPYIHFPHFGNSNLGKLPYGEFPTIRSHFGSPKYSVL